MLHYYTGTQNGRTVVVSAIQSFVIERLHCIHKHVAK